jgi:hypothetical protein
MSTSDTSSISSDTCDLSEVSDELQQEWKEALTQCQHIQELHTTILQHMDRIKHVTDFKSIFVVCHGQTRELNDMLEEIYNDSVQEFDKTGKKQFGTMLMEMLETCEFT